MIINSGKCLVLISGYEKETTNTKNNHITTENKKQLLGIFTGSRLKFKDHINNLHKKASLKLNTWPEVSPI